MESKMAQFFQRLTVDGDAMRRFQGGAESRDALLIEAGFDVAERALIQSEDGQAMHSKMMADRGMSYAYAAHSNNNNNSNNNISRFKRPDARAL